MRIFHNHNLREDWKQGLYKSKTTDEEKKIEKSIFLLSSKSMFIFYGKKVLEKWPFSCQHYLTEPNRNKKAYLGQASCCYFCGSPEYITKIAWNKLTKKKQEEANLVADDLIRKYTRELINNNQLKFNI
jgi:hypothetical protein